MRKGKYYKHTIIGRKDVIYIKFIRKYKGFSGVYKLCKVVKMPEDNPVIDIFLGKFLVGKEITLSTELEVERVPDDEAIFLALGEE